MVSGEERLLPARVGSGVLRRIPLLLGVRHQSNIHTAVLCPAVFAAIGRSRLFFAQANHVNLVYGNFLPPPILVPRIPPAFAPFLVLFCRPYPIPYPLPPPHATPLAPDFPH